MPFFCIEWQNHEILNIFYLKGPSNPVSTCNRQSTEVVIYKMLPSGKPIFRLLEYIHEICGKQHILFLSSWCLGHKNHYRFTGFHAISFETFQIFTFWLGFYPWQSARINTCCLRSTCISFLLPVLCVISQIYITFTIWPILLSLQLFWEFKCLAREPVVSSWSFPI